MFIHSRNRQTIFRWTARRTRGGDFDSRYSQKGVQWVVKETAKRAGIRKWQAYIRSGTALHAFIEDGMDILTLKTVGARPY